MGLGAGLLFPKKKKDPLLPLRSGQPERQRAGAGGHQHPLGAGLLFPKKKILFYPSGVGNQNDNVLVLGATNIPWVLDCCAKKKRFSFTPQEWATRTTTCWCWGPPTSPGCWIVVQKKKDSLLPLRSGQPERQRAGAGGHQHPL